MQVAHSRLKMAAPSQGGGITHVLLDLDGTLLDTETLCIEVAHTVLGQYGRTLTDEAATVSGLLVSPLALECGIPALYAR